LSGSIVSGLPPELVTETLCVAASYLGRPDQVGLVHAFVRAVLLGLSGQDALVLNAQAQPPHVQLRETVNPRRREGHAVVAFPAPENVAAKRCASEKRAF